MMLVGMAMSWQGMTAHGQIVTAENVATPAADRIRWTREPISMIPAGTKFGDQAPAGWSHLISFVRSRLTSGDVQSVSETIRYYGEIFNLVMLGHADLNGQGKYELDKVAIGFSMMLKGVHTIVTAETQSELGADLNLIGRSVLDGNMESLQKVQQVARTPNSLLIDAPAIMLRDGKHRDMIVRYYVWVFPENGNLGTLVWLLDRSSEDDSYRMADTTAELLPANMREERVINVDADQFILGIPSKKAFAMVEIPQGISFAISDEMKTIGAKKNYTAETFAKLTTAITKTLQSGQRSVATQPSK